MIHFPAAPSREIKLCYAHDIELFKMGQVRFLLKYGASLTPKDESLNAQLLTLGR